MLMVENNNEKSYRYLWNILTLCLELFPSTFNEVSTSCSDLYGLYCMYSYILANRAPCLYYTYLSKAAVSQKTETKKKQKQNSVLFCFIFCCSSGWILFLFFVKRLFSLHIWNCHIIDVNLPSQRNLRLDMCRILLLPLYKIWA